ncbi:hypothetical protein [Streptomyces sp. URMC 129]|uniref:hypothetical protein n=1 Tax=Streptomyces sp. URMC 129 TaxID=3423407 RepID=UPI003F1D0652
MSTRTLPDLAELAAELAALRAQVAELTTTGGRDRDRMTYAQYAAELGIEESWLRRHIKRLHHHKAGRCIWFTAEDRARNAAEVFHHRPVTASSAGPTSASTAAGAHPLSGLVPIPRGRRRAY